jgi:hypothetical protein
MMDVRQRSKQMATGTRRMASSAHGALTYGVYVC